MLSPDMGRSTTFRATKDFKAQLRAKMAEAEKLDEQKAQPQVKTNAEEGP